MNASGALQGAKILNKTLFAKLNAMERGDQIVHGLLQAYAPIDPGLLSSVELGSMKKLVNVYSADSIKNTSLKKKSDMVSVLAELVLQQAKSPELLHQVLSNL